LVCRLLVVVHVREEISREIQSKKGFTFVNFLLGLTVILDMKVACDINCHKEPADTKKDKSENECEKAVKANGTT